MCVDICGWGTASLLTPSEQRPRALLTAHSAQGSNLQQVVFPFITSPGLAWATASRYLRLEQKPKHVHVGSPGNFTPRIPSKRNMYICASEGTGKDSWHHYLWWKKISWKQSKWSLSVDRLNQLRFVVHRVGQYTMARVDLQDAGGKPRDWDTFLPCPSALVLDSDSPAREAVIRHGFLPPGLSFSAYSCALLLQTKQIGGLSVLPLKR